MVRSANRRNTIVSFFVAAVALVVVPSPALAQGPGVRGGVSVDPDQFYLGGHYETGALVDRLHFKPNLEAGFGDDLTHIGLNFEFVYKFPANNDWSLYAGAGPAVNIYSFDEIDDERHRSRIQRAVRRRDSARVVLRDQGRRARLTGSSSSEWVGRFGRTRNDEGRRA